MKKHLLLFFTFLLYFQFAYSQEKIEHIIKFNISSRDELEKITRMVSIDAIDDNIVTAYVNNKQLEKFKQSNYSFIILPTPSEKSAKVTMATTVSEMSNWDKYPTHEVYTEMMRQFGIDHPDICRIDTIGFTENGREVLVAKISDNIDIQEDEPEVFYTGQMHGDEIVDYIMFLRLIDYLLDNYDNNTQVQNIINNTELWINPLSNPDGTYSGGDNTVNSATRSNANGVDLNRNYPDPDDGPHPDSYAYQAETQMMMNFADTHNFSLSCNSHSGAEVMNYPWDTWNRRHVDDSWFQYASLVYANLAIANSPSGYFTGISSSGIINGSDWYLITGGRQDYMNYFKNCREITLELSEAKMLSSTELPNHWDYNKEAMLALIEESLYGFRGTVKNSSDEPLYAKIEISDHDADIDSSMVFTDADVGDYHRMIDEGTYDITASAYGYIPQTINNVSIANGYTVTKNFVLTQASTTNITGIIIDGESGNPLENVKVELQNCPVDAVYTNSNGEYTISNIMEDNYSIRVSLSNYASIVQDISVTETNNEFNFELYIADIEDFETNNFANYDWQHSGNKNWTITSSEKYEGVYSAVSGNISDNQISVLEVELQIEQAGKIEFYKKVSSEVSYDYLKFYIDDVEKGSWSGTINWGKESYSVTTGNHTFKWEYIKDSGVDNGSDCAWIDYITFPKILKIPAKLDFTPDTIDIEMDVDDTHQETINISNIGGTTLNYNIAVENAASNTWISLDNSSGSLDFNDSDNIVATINTDDSENTYNCNIIISHNGSKSDTIIPVTVIASYHPELNISEDEILKTVLEDSSTTCNIELSNIGTGTISYNAEVENFEVNTWISIDNNSGSLIDNTETICVTLNADGLIAQQYSCNIIITDDSKQTTTIPVLLNVQEPNVLSVSPESVSINIPNNLCDSSIIELSNIFTQELSYEISFNNPDDTNWIKLSSLSGNISPNDSSEIELFFNPKELDIGNYTNKLFITNNLNSNTTIIPIALNVINPAVLEFNYDTIKHDIYRYSKDSIMLGISKTGNIDINYNISILNDNNWLSTDISDGLIENRETDSVKFIFDANNLSISEYNCNIQIINKLTTDTSFIPVFLNVKEELGLVIEQDSITMKLNKNTNASDTLFIEKTGDIDIEYDIEIENSISNSWITLNKTSGNIENDIKENVVIFFDSNNLDYGTYECNIIINDDFGKIYTIPVKLSVSSTLGFNDISSNINIDTYPNPFSEKIDISINLEKPSGIFVTIYNIKGQSIKDFNFIDKKESTYHITWPSKSEFNNNCKNGIYIIRVISSENSFCTKIIKQ